MHPHRIHTSAGSYLWPLARGSVIQSCPVCFFLFCFAVTKALNHCVCLHLALGSSLLSRTSGSLSSGSRPSRLLDLSSVGLSAPPRSSTRGG